MSSETSPKPRAPRKPSAATIARNRRKSIASAIAVVIIVVVVGAIWLITNRGDDTTPSAVSSSSAAVGSSSTKSNGKIPARVSATLALIDAGRWPEAANAPGTQGGRSFRNNEGRLPRKSLSGKVMRYQEWDINAKASNRGRDAERIITAADGSAWYSLDHYRTFVKIRGPNS
ncbi:ribonuclease domain-containing protein [Gordonia sp. CPCC 205333]|uniref:ribonuclease domain-containing protein n=1 Tax=Gordonia sp. CPCC 205333 TaxID=3140790 RepID=UPI003AF3C008